MKKQIRKLIAISLAAMLLLSSCAPADNGEDDENASVPAMNTTDDITLKIWWMDSELQRPVLDKAIAKFKKAYPNITVQPQWVTSYDEDTYTKLRMQLQGGNDFPDIVKLDHVYISTLGYNEQLLDLRSMGARELADQFIESCWQANVYKDGIYALPFDANTIAMYYNKNIFQKAGKEPPSTYEEIIEAGKAIQAPNLPDTFVYTLPTSTQTANWLSLTYLMWLWRNGGEVLNEDWSEVAFNSPEGVAALEQMVRLIKTEKIVPASQYLEGEFYTGMVGMIDMGCWSMNKCFGSEKVTEDEFGIVKMPVLKKDVPAYSGLGLYSLGITKKSKHSREAYEFVKMLSTDAELQAEYAQTTAVMPSLKSAYDNEAFKTDNWVLFREQLELAKARPGTPVWPEIKENIEMAVQEAFSDLKTPKQALDEAAQRCNYALEEIDDE